MIIRKNLKLMLITSLVTLLPLLVGLCLWNRLPDQLPFHWNAAGEVDGWAGKPMAVIGAPLLMLALHWLCVLITAADPKNKNHSGKMQRLILWIIPLLSVVIFGMIFSTAWNKDLHVASIAPILIGVLFVILGNYLPKCKQSYTIGIKLPWTLHSEANWNKTHRLAGFLWVLGGFAMMIAGFFGGLWAILPIALGMTLIPTGYSYLLYRKGI
jgi:uncharacterized membrane protein